MIECLNERKRSLCSDGEGGEELIEDEDQRGEEEEERKRELNGNSNGMAAIMAERKKSR